MEPTLLIALGKSILLPIILAGAHGSCIQMTDSTQNMTNGHLLELVVSWKAPMEYTTKIQTLQQFKWIHGLEKLFLGESSSRISKGTI
jgi:hypothetical protein